MILNKLNLTPAEVDAMKPERLRWLEAMESGNYRQGRQQLRRDDSVNADPPAWIYCCLGMACDLIRPDAWRSRSHEGGGKDDVWIDNNYQLPPMQMMADVYGLDTTEVTHLAHMNDEGESFRGIAAKLRLDWGLLP